ncbi:MAG: hypothetical protein ACOVP4_11095 [Bacteriovoracaceae bacterium]
MKLLFITCMAFSLSALAFNKSTPQECSPLTLKESLNSDTRNQREIAWCYAFTSADLIGQAYQLPEPVSAADVALRYNKSFAAKIVQFFRRIGGGHSEDPIERYLPHQTGFSKVAIERVYKDGWCPESVFPSELWTRHIRTNKGWETSKVPLKQAFREMLELSRHKNDLNFQNLPYYYSFKNIETPDTFLRLLQKYRYDEFLQQLRLTACKDDRYRLPQRNPVLMVIKNPGIFNRIHSQLNAGRLISLDYDARVLEEFKKHKLSLANLHTSILLGRQWNTDRNECEYLVRDSYGKDCIGYDPEARCSQGYVWLPESMIYRNMTSIVYQATK